MRAMAVDYGDARTGVAFSDISRNLTGDAFVLHEKSFGRLVSELTVLIKERDVTTVVVGNPINMDGTRGKRSEKSQKLAEAVREAAQVETVLWDERRTTVDAHRILHEAGRHGKKGRKLTDAVAASLILEGYLCSRLTET